MDVEVRVAGSNKRILVRIPSNELYSSSIMLGVPSPRQIQLGDTHSSCSNKENMIGSNLSLPNSSTPHSQNLSSTVINTKGTNSETHSNEKTSQINTITDTLQNQRLAEAQLENTAVLKSANPNTTTRNTSEGLSKMETDEPNKSPLSYSDPLSITTTSTHCIESQMSKLVAKRIVYLADAAVNKLFGPPEKLSPEFVPHARQLRQQLLIILAGVVKEHLRQKTGGFGSARPPLERQMVQEDEFQRSLMPPVQTRVR